MGINEESNFGQQKTREAVACGRKNQMYQK
jgi:hypothetical protein